MRATLLRAAGALLAVTLEATVYVAVAAGIVAAVEAARPLFL